MLKRAKSKAVVLSATALALMAYPLQASSGLSDCPARYRVLNEPPGDPFECLCTTEIQRQEGTVKLYGSGPYDSVSNICIAAVHAGVTPPEGGPVRVVPRPPQDSFEGTLANGVYSEDWGSSLFNTFDVEPVTR